MPYPHSFQHYRAVGQAERGDPEAALMTCTEGRLAFPSANQWAGQNEGCELCCWALLQDADWPERYAERQHFLPRPGTAPHAGKRIFSRYVLLAHIAHIAHIALGDLEAAAALYPIVAPDARRRLAGRAAATFEGLVGLAAAAGGNWDAAEGHFRSALAFVDEIGDRLGKPSVQKWYAWMLLRRDAPGDRDHARVRLETPSRRSAPWACSSRLARPKPCDGPSMADVAVRLAS